MNFRSDINGLRAIAVISVVLFHFHPKLVPGGFIGVDIFFVISGFLMTEIIFRNFKNNSFNLLKFYIARANRIFPALAVLCLILLFFGWFYLTPSDYLMMGKHVASSIMFLSNMTYWSESGYFDATTHEKWLLHTWSLSVEWQFYVIYPVVLIIFKKFLSINNLKKTFLIGTFLGLIFSFFLTIECPTLAYYLFPTRSWEMMFGGIAYLYPVFLKDSYKKIIERSGFILIILSYFLISSATPWPSYYAIFPVLGAYLIIVSNQQDSIITNNILFQRIGNMSYSIYLWHWPSVILVNYYLVLLFNNNNKFYLLLVYLLLTAILSSASYYFIEKRHRKILLVLFTTSLFLSFFVIFTDGKNKNYNKHNSNLSAFWKNYWIDNTFNYHNFSEEKWKNDKRKKVLIIGDSHTLSWASALSYSYPDIAFHSVSYLGCNMTIIKNKLFINPIKNDYKEQCNFAERSLNNTDITELYDVVVLASYRPFSYGANKWRFKLPKFLPKTKWVILGNYYQLEPDKSCSKYSVLGLSKLCLTKSNYPVSINSYKEESMFDSFNKANYTYINIIKEVCTKGKSTCYYENDGVAMMNDWNHLNPYFIKFLIDKMKPTIDRAIYK